jgi:uncharacterized membrane protein
MAENDKNLDLLEKRLENLVRTQIDFQKEIIQIRQEIALLRGESGASPPVQEEKPPVRPPVQTPPHRPQWPQPPEKPTFRGPEAPPQTPPKASNELPPKWSASPPPEAQQPPQQPLKQGPPRPIQTPPRTAGDPPPPRQQTGGYRQSPPPPPREAGAPNFGYWAGSEREARPPRFKNRSELEKFIGENLISKIGIIVLIIGVGIGAKYAIDKGWITPLMRVIFGYAVGFGLLGFAVKLKPKYHNFSAVLLSGGMAIMYFITYFAYALYELIPQPAAFALMVIFTVFTVAAAIIYSRQVIAHVGLVGAYAVPFLLSNNSGNYPFLFTYMALINVGILAVSVKKYWKPLSFTAFVFTWATFGGWFATKYRDENHFFIALLFLGIFFATFYLVTIIQHRLFEERTDMADQVLTIFNAIVFYGFTVAMIDQAGAYNRYITLFTYTWLFTVAVLITSLRDYRRALLYAGFAGNWLLFFTWFSGKYRTDEHFFLALTFLGIFFATFYLVTIVQHRFFEQLTGLGDLILTIFNTFIFYGFSFAILFQSAHYGRFLTQFTYLGAFTLAILIVSIRDYRRPLLLVSFACTWLIFFYWYMTKYRADEHFYLGASFLGAFFLIFYITALVHSHIFKERAVVENVAPILTNSFIFFGIGYSMLHVRPEFANYMGLYTMAHAAFHFLFAAGTSRARAFPIEITYLLAALVLTFITIAVPVQFDGNVITLVWAVEGAILFGIGRMKQIPLYEYFSYPLMILATGSLANDWIASWGARDPFELAKNTYPLANGIFISAIVYVLSLAFVYYINRDERYETPTGNEDVRKAVKYLTGSVALLALYNTFRAEIGNYFNYETVRTGVKDRGYPYTDGNLTSLNIIWQLNYTMLFLTLLAGVNIRKLKSLAVGSVNIAAGVIIALLFCTAALLLFGDLRESYRLQREAEFFYRGIFLIVVRYISLVLAGGLFFALYRYTKQHFLQRIIAPITLTLGFDALFYPLLLIIVSSELINCMDLAGYNDSYKLGLSILWGVYALFLVVIGIYFKKRHLRIGAIVLFAITLAKLFLYDISQLSTVAKTVVFVSVGILMLIVSFLYNKYKTVIFGMDDNLPG